MNGSLNLCKIMMIVLLMLCPTTEGSWPTIKYSRYKLDLLALVYDTNQDGKTVNVSRLFLVYNGQSANFMMFNNHVTEFTAFHKLKRLDINCNMLLSLDPRYSLVSGLPSVRDGYVRQVCRVKGDKFFVGYTSACVNGNVKCFELYKITYFHNGTVMCTGIGIEIDEIPIFAKSQNLIVNTSIEKIKRAAYIIRHDNIQYIVFMNRIPKI